MVSLQGVGLRERVNEGGLAPGATACDVEVEWIMEITSMSA